jgi:GntR family transcriptional repressor for pyruvate dehydrogenase complex
MPTPIAIAPLPPRQSVVATCAAAVRRAILAGDLEPGSRLPPERDLADTLGVNRTTLRAALRELDHEGLLRVRQGSAYVVQPWREACGPELMPLVATLTRDPARRLALCGDLLELRRRLAITVLERLASATLTQGTMGAIEEQIDAMDALAARKPRATSAEFARADTAILRALLAATESDVFRLFTNPVGPLLEALPELCDALYAEPETNVAAYRALAAGLATGNLPIAAIAEAMRTRDDLTLERLTPSRAAGKRAPKPAASDRTLALPFAPKGSPR